MTPLIHALACLLVLGLASFLWRGKITLLKESLLILAFFLLSVLFTILAGDLRDPNMELYPFRKIINAGVDMIMVSHLNVPALDSAKKSIVV